jgi:predicted nucleic acid-binding protein
VKIYLDACCLSRFTDDQLQLRIRDEATALERIFAQVRRGYLELISSEPLEDEVRRQPILQRRLEAETLLSLASKIVEVGDSVTQRARDLQSVGYGLYDALHLAAAESAGADVLLSTDDRFIKRAARRLGHPRVPVRNPVSWIKEQGL